MAGCAWDKGWLGSTCPRVHSRELVRPNGCCIGGGREGLCPANCPGEVVNNASGAFCECQMPCDPPQPEECQRPADFDECASSPCQNGGACTGPEPDMYECTCAGGWLGENCDIPPPVRIRSFRIDRERCAGASPDRLLKRAPSMCCLVQCDDPTSFRTVVHCNTAGKCHGYDDVSVDCLACLDGCSGRPGKPGVNNWCWYYNTNFPAVCADVDQASAGAECTDDCLATGWRDVPLQIIDPAVRSHSPTV
jgi:hypothetical protein